MTQIEGLNGQKISITTPLLDKNGNLITEYPLGFIQVVDHMGNDDSIVQAARISYGAGTKSMREDRGLIRYLMRNQHTTPFEMVEIKFLIRCPMDVWRQWIRHRTASVNEYSTRYSHAIEDTHQTSPEKWRKQSTTNKQGSTEGDFLSRSEGEFLSHEERELHSHITQVYEKRLDMNVAREQARKDLPLATFTEAYWKIDGKNLLHFLKLRMDPHAQEEIRRFAEAIATVVAQWLPVTWEAFVDYELEAVKFSRMEMDALRHLLQNVDRLEYEAFDTPELTKSERAAFIAKVA